MAMDNYTKMALRYFTELSIRREKENKVMEKPQYLQELDSYFEMKERIKAEVNKDIEMEVAKQLRDFYHNKYDEVRNKYLELLDITEKLAYYAKTGTVDEDLTKALNDFYGKEWL